MRELAAVCARGRGGEAMGVGWRVLSWGASTIRPREGMTVARSEPDPQACASEGAAVGDAVAGDGADRSARGRGGLRLMAASDRDGSPALVDAERNRRGEHDRASETRRVRRLRLAVPVQLELVSGREGSPPDVVWASLPERAQEAVLVLLARLIGSGAVEERERA